MKIRSVRPNDRAAWSDMRTRLWPSTDDGHLGDIDAYFAGSSTDIVEVLLLVDADERPAGFLELNLRNFAEGSRSPEVPYIEAWFVGEEFRGQGHGSALIRAAEHWARMRGYRELASDTEVDNRTSIAMHRRLGFVETERVVCFLKRLA